MKVLPGNVETAEMDKFEVKRAILFIENKGIKIMSKKNGNIGVSFRFF